MTGNNQGGYQPAEIDAIAGWLKAGLSASRIADELSQLRRSPISRNAIIGVVHRNKRLKAIGFDRRRGENPVGSAKPTSTKHEQRHAAGNSARWALPPKQFIHAVGGRETDHSVAFLFAPAPPVRPRPVIAAAVYDAGTRKISLLDLRDNECRFPVNNAPLGETHLFCGEATGIAQPYCTHHAARCATARAA